MKSATRDHVVAATHFVLGPSNFVVIRLPDRWDLRLGRQPMDVDYTVVFDGVRWVDLGTLTPSDDVAFACLTAPGMRVEPERKALTTLATCKPGGRSSCPFGPRGDRFRPRNSTSPAPACARWEAMRLRTRSDRLTSGSSGRNSTVSCMWRTGVTKPSASSTSGSCTAGPRSSSKASWGRSRGAGAIRPRAVPPARGWPQFLE